MKVLFSLTLSTIIVSSLLCPGVNGEGDYPPERSFPNTLSPETSQNSMRDKNSLINHHKVRPIGRSPHRSVFPSEGFRRTYNKRNPASSPHVISLINQKPTFTSEAGSITSLTADNFPILKRLSIRRLTLKHRGVREPHWHANGSELAYCLRGEVIVTMFENNSVFSTFTVTAGQMFYIPSGALHHIENTGEEEAEIILAFTHERPEDFGISGAFGAMSDAVLGNTYNLPAKAFKPLIRTTKDTHMGLLQKPKQVTTEEKWVNPHKFDVEAMSAPISSLAGSAKTARKQFWPILDEISMYSLRVTDKGMREPHWHPITAEMGYVAKGNARMTIMNPGGGLDTYLLKPGDVYFIPRAYPHHIENIGSGDIHFLIFFDQNTPGDIGYKASISGYSRETLAAAFGTNVEKLPQFPFTAKDPLLVDRINPVDPIVQ
ncbi:bicupin, oxalate decarboxylase family [Basidiobolus meristosporus CBS 931.73]|uniref:Bicupin, oxalate decarboxylase family n=1 Tax=Basidiobolus meristosporus CBS 931.73 TaxID=1314790 RepID=A0A1Y1YMX8_9FUNG|nr:bicupin, oxalate decarboxylase family [Basidiobolus meristosporus CBS 931.73]|eukprot:ORX99387.1 bicupin, oxalate decarboxylase family [Basidiobolus meristosporus CBS 931.73]